MSIAGHLPWLRPRLRVGATPSDVVFRENKWRLLRYRALHSGAEAPAGRPVLLVPSLINRSYVLDLTPGKSFVEHLVANGHDVFAIDWGTPGDEDRFLHFDDFVDWYLGRAIRQVARTAPEGKVHLLGYCLGGTLAAIHAALYSEHIASLVTLAAPISFHDEGLLSRWTRTPSFDVGALVRGFGNVPAALMQAAFQLLRPTLGLNKAVGLVDRMWDDEYLDAFFALEAWGSDNVPFPGGVYQRYIEELYRNDALVRGTFTVAGRRVNLRELRCPLMAVTFEHDHIVPWRSAAALLERAGSDDKRHIHLSGGHVGAVVSKHAKRSLWPELERFWASLATVQPPGRAGVVSVAPAAPREPLRSSAS